MREPIAALWVPALESLLTRPQLLRPSTVNAEANSDEDGRGFSRALEQHDERQSGLAKPRDGRSEWVPPYGWR